MVQDHAKNISGQSFLETKLAGVAMGRKSFITLSELASDAGFTGRLIRKIPESWRIANFAQARKEADPWKYLLSLPAVPKPFQKLFRAAQSHQKALRKVSEIASSRGSLETSWTTELTKAKNSGDQKRMNHAQMKVFRAHWKYDRAQSLLGAAKKKSPADEAYVLRMIDTAYKKDLQKLGRKKADSKPKPANFDPTGIQQRVLWCMVTGWLQTSNGSPALCFFTDNALTMFLAEHLKIPQLQFDLVRKTRRFLGLTKGPLIVYGVKKAPKNTWVLLGRDKNPI